jgi:endonuclease III
MVRIEPFYMKEKINLLNTNSKRSSMNKIDALLSNFRLYSEDLGINLEEPEGRFKWFLASILFGARISERIAMNTYKVFEGYGILSLDKILNAGWDELVRILDEGGYVRYDFSTATKLLNIMKEIKERYGSLEDIYIRSLNTEDLKMRLKELKGIGDVTTQIFLRELRGIWEIEIPVSSRIGETVSRLNINIEEFEGERLSRIESALIKLNIRYCKKKKCAGCPVEVFCNRQI